VAFILLLVIGAGCGDGTREPAADGVTPAPETSPARPTPEALPPLALPELSRLAPAVQAQLQAAWDGLARSDGAAAPSADRAAARGALGKLLLAAGFRQAAVVAFQHAEALAPADARWPYYRAHAQYGDGQVVEAAAAFDRARQLQPDDVPTLLWVGRTHLDLAQPDLAEQAFERARSLQPRSGAALLGLGEVSLARRQASQAIAWLEEAAAVDPAATPIRHALATAYRMAGRPETAGATPQASARARVRMPDPLMEEIETLLETGVAYEIRGSQALERRDWAAAIELFRKGIALSPDEPSLRHKLGTALSLAGDPAGALREFETVVRRWPAFAKGHYSLGIMLAAQGRIPEARARFRTATEHDPQDAQAHVQLAEADRVLGRYADAAAGYARALTLDPRVAAAHFGRAMALAGAKRYRDAADGLTQAIGLFPDEGAFRHAQARLLASAPDEGVRDGTRALAILQGLGIERRWTVPMAETMAMALAEVGRFDEAAQWQRDAMAEAKKTGADPLLPRLAGNLRLYEQRRPCRLPWGDELRVATL